MSFKQELERALETRPKLEPLIFETELGGEIEHKLDQYLYRKINLTGEHVNDIVILLDNQMHNGQAGYRLYTLFNPKADRKLNLNEHHNEHHKVILLDRGWIPMGSNRSLSPPSLPLAIPPSTPDSINFTNLIGLITKPVSPGFNIDGTDQTFEILNKSPLTLRVQTLNPSTFAQTLKNLVDLSPPVQLYNFIVHQNTQQNAQLSIPIQQGLSSERHLGYAIQWFMLAFALFLYFSYRSCHITRAC